MKPDTCLVIDVWEGQLEIDEAVLKANGVAGIGIRLNNINGGTHMDSNFLKQWDKAAGFVRFPYFVYNPWASGRENFLWLEDNMPFDTMVVAVQISVIKPDSVASAYSDEVAIFLAGCAANGWKVIIYTGGWFLPQLKSWPALDYWWAQYPAPEFYFKDTTTWDDLKLRLDKLTLPFNYNMIPGRLKLWQFSGDRLTLPGSTRKLDVSLFYGSQAALAAYFCNPALPGTPPGDTPAPGYPVGSALYTFTPAAYWQRPAGGPLLTPMYDTTRTSGKKEILLDAAWQNYLRSTNTPRAYAKLSAPDWGPSKGLNTKGQLILNTLAYPGRNVVRILQTRIGLDRAPWGRVESLSATQIPAATVNAIDTPHLVHRVYGSNDSWTWFPLKDAPLVPLVSDSATWIRMEWLAPIPLPKVVKVKGLSGLNVRQFPGVANKLVGVKFFNQSITISELQIAKGGIWGKCESGWVALRYNDNNLTDWQI